MPPVAITNVVPIETIVRIATFWASSDRLLTVPNLPGASTEKMTMSAIRKPRVMNTWLASSVRQRDRCGSALRVTSVVASTASSALSAGLVVRRHAGTCSVT